MEGDYGRLSAHYKYHHFYRYQLKMLSNSIQEYFFIILVIMGLKAQVQVYSVPSIYYLLTIAYDCKSYSCEV